MKPERGRAVFLPTEGWELSSLEIDSVVGGEGTAPAPTCTTGDNGVVSCVCPEGSSVRRREEDGMLTIECVVDTPPTS